MKLFQNDFCYIILITKQMKNLNKLGVILFLATASIFTSCSSDDNGGGSSTASLGTITATVDGASFTTITQGTNASIANNGTYQNLAITGSTITGKTIILSILGQNIGVGTYPIVDEDTDFIATAVYSSIDLANPTAAQTWSAPYTDMGTTSSISITSISATNVQGTFHFVGLGDNDQTKEITNGSFNVNIN